MLRTMKIASYQQPECPLSRRYYFRQGSTAFAHGIIGIEYEPEAHLPWHSPFSGLVRRLQGQSHAGPIVTLLIDHHTLHDWMAPAYGAEFSRVRVDTYGRVVGPNTEYHSKAFNDLLTSLKQTYEQLPCQSDKALSFIFSHGQDASALPPDAEAETLEAMGRPRIAAQEGYCSKIVMRLARPDRLPGLLHHLPLPKSEPLIDQRDVENAVAALTLTHAEKLAHQKDASRNTQR